MQSIQSDITFCRPTWMTLTYMPSSGDDKFWEKSQSSWIRLFGIQSKIRAQENSWKKYFKHEKKLHSNYRHEFVMWKNRPTHLPRSSKILPLNLHVWNYGCNVTVKVTKSVVFIPNKCCETMLSCPHSTKQ